MAAMEKFDTKQRDRYWHGWEQHRSSQYAIQKNRRNYPDRYVVSMAIAHLRIEACNVWFDGQGLPRGEVLYELSHPETGVPLAVMDLVWPRGVKERLNQLVVLLLNEGEEVEEIVNQAGYRFFTDPAKLCAYVEMEILSKQEPVS